MPIDKKTSQHYAALIKKAKDVFSKHNSEDVKEAIGNVLVSMLVKQLRDIIVNDEGYFMRSVKRQLLNIINHKKYLQKNERITAFNFYGSDNPKVDIDEFKEDEFIKFIEASLQFLPQGQADVIRLVLDRKTNREIAIKLGIQMNNVKQRKYLAIKRLREILHQSQHDF